MRKRVGDSVIGKLIFMSGNYSKQLLSIEISAFFLFVASLPFALIGKPLRMIQNEFDKNTVKFKVF